MREKAAEALGRIGDDRTVEPLIERLKDRRWSTRKAAAAALVAMYEGGRIGEDGKGLILAQRSRMNERHYDGYAAGPHEDTGIGIGF